MRDDKMKKKKKEGKVTPAKAEFWEDVDKKADKMVGKRSLAC